jgi:hypothetical protein
MKKIILFTLAFSALAANISAQDLKVGFTAGLELSKYSTDYITDKQALKPGFKAAITADYVFSRYFALSAELQLAQRGVKTVDVQAIKSNGDAWKQPNSDENIYGKYSETLNYLQIPFNLVFSLPISENGKIFVFSGIYWGAGMDGKYKYVTDLTAANQSGTISFGSKNEIWGPNPDNPEYEILIQEGQYKKNDFGLNFGVGYDWANLQFKLQTNRGLINMSNNEGMTCKNVNYSFSVGFLFD